MSDTTTPLQRETTVPRPPLDQRLRDLNKRLFDILVSALGLLLLSPLFLIVAVRLKRESPGPVFFRQTRVGRNGGLFDILKFRTMYERPESYAGPGVTARDDLRVTPFGRFLRRAKLNELPQLWNVLKGEMSLVGPRPELPEIVSTWPAGARADVLSMRPGVTSPASINFRDEENLLSSANVMDDYLKGVMPDKLRLDQLYVRTHSFLGDLDVIFTTLAGLLPQLRESEFSPETLYNGQLSRFVHRYIAWYMIDSLVAFAAIALAGVIWRLERPLDLGWGRAIGMGALMALVFGLVNAARGLGKLSWQHARPAYAFDIFLSSFITTLGMAALGWFWPQGRFFPTSMVIVAGLLAFFGFLSVRYRERLLTGLAWRWLSTRDPQGALGERVLIVGAGQGGLLISWLLQHGHLSRLFSIIGMVDDDPSKAGMTIDGHRVFGLTRRIPELVEKYNIGVILFTIEKIHPDEQARILDLCRGTRARLIMVPDLMAMFRERLTNDDQRERLTNDDQRDPLNHNGQSRPLTHQDQPDRLTRDDLPEPPPAHAAPPPSARETPTRPAPRPRPS